MNSTNKTDQNSKMSGITTVKSCNDNKVKITLPSLCDYGDSDDEEEEEIVTNPKLKNIAQTSSSAPGPAPAPNNSVKKPGLLGILPPPKSNQFIKKDSNFDSKKASSQPFLLPRTLNTNINSAPSIKKTINNLGDDHEINNKTKKLKTDESVKPLNAFTEKSKPCFNEYKYEEDPPIRFDGDDDEDYEQDREQNDEEGNKDTELDKDQASSSNRIYEAPSSSNLMDQEAWMKLCGSKRKKDEAIQFMDVNAKEIVGNNRAELMKQITDEYKPALNKDYGLGVGRKKSQITYLAFVAKERDQELKTMWSQQKYTRQQAKQKYGF